jgi:RNA polymerase sigma-70 factor (ECF subfamily)
MSQPDAEQLLTAAQAGNSSALEALLAKHRQTVFRYGLRYCKTTEDAEDAVQETLWAATRSIRGFRRAAAITTWLFTIVRNKCHRLNSRAPANDLADLLPFIADDAESAEQQIATRQTEQLLAHALAKLEPTHREAVILRDVEGLTAPEAAARLSISVSALKSRLHRARADLRREVIGILPSLH